MATTTSPTTRKVKAEKPAETLAPIVAETPAPIVDEKVAETPAPVVDEKVAETNTNTESETSDMSETTTEPTNPAEAHELKTIRDLWAKVAAAEIPMHEAYNALKAATPPSDDEVERLVAESTDEAVSGLRNEIAGIDTEIARLEKLRDEHAESASKLVLAGFELPTEEETNRARAAFTTAITKVRTTLAILRNMVSPDGIDIPDVYKFTTDYELPTLRSTQRTTAASGGGGTLVRVAKIVIKKGDDEMTYARMAQASAYLRVDNAEFISAWLNASGHSNWKEVTTEVTFSIDDASVTVTPKPRA